MDGMTFEVIVGFSVDSPLARWDICAFVDTVNWVRDKMWIWKLFCHLLI